MVSKQSILSEMHVAGNAPMAKNDLTLKLGYEFGEGNYLEAKVGRTDLDAEVSYIGLSQEDFTSNPYQRYHNTARANNMDSEQTRYYFRYLKAIDEDTPHSKQLYFITNLIGIGTRLIKLEYLILPITVSRIGSQ